MERDPYIMETCNVYIHYRKDDKIPFYVGIGSIFRAHSGGTRRSKWWHNVVNKHGYYVDIVCKDISIENAKLVEIFLIKSIGRSDKNKGPLVNLTDGGDGRFGSVHSKETREKLSKSKIKPLVEKKCEYCSKSFYSKPAISLKRKYCSISCSMKSNPRGGRKVGHIVTEETREKLRISKTGKYMSEEAKNKMSISQKSVIRNRDQFGRWK